MPTRSEIQARYDAITQEQLETILLRFGIWRPDTVKARIAGFTAPEETSAAPVSGQGASIETPRFQELARRLRTTMDDVFEIELAEMVAHINYWGKGERIRSFESGFKSGIDSRPRSEDSRAKVLEEAIEFMLAYENDDVGAIQEIQQAFSSQVAVKDAQEFARCYCARKMRAALATSAAPERATAAESADFVAYAEDGVLHWLTGRKFQDCKLYTRPAPAERSSAPSEAAKPVAIKWAGYYMGDPATGYTPGFLTDWQLFDDKADCDKRVAPSGKSYCARQLWIYDAALAAPSPTVAPSEDSREGGGVPDAVRAWFDGESNRLAAIGAYNAKIEAGGISFPGPECDAEFQAMEAAKSAEHKLRKPMHDAMIKWLAAAPAPKGGA